MLDVKRSKGFLHGGRANPREGHCQSCDKFSAAAVVAFFVLGKRFAETKIQRHSRDGDHIVPWLQLNLALRA